MPVILLVFLAGCDAISTAGDDAPPKPRTQLINCPCDLYSTSTEWVYCAPVEVDLVGLPIQGVVMNYSLRITRGGDVLEAELYDLVEGRTVPLSRVESVIGYIMHTRKTEDLSGYISGKASLAIRFRVNREGAVGYIPNNSRIEVTYKD